jgi:nucleoside-diphosphate-sugar epimerase
MPTKTSPISRVLVLGAGYAGLAVARLARARGLRALLSTRSEERARALEHEGFEVLVAPPLDARFAALVTPNDHVVVCFPPDGATDASLAPALAGAGASTYLSTTGVYEGHRGHVDARTPVAESPSPRIAARLDAERHYLAAGAVVLRCPGIYGPDRGLHRRVIEGKHRIPGDGSRYLSRIHVDDLAAFVLASSRLRSEVLVVGDREPAPHGEVVRWIAEHHGVDVPPSVPLEEVHETLRADRRVDPSQALRLLGVALRYPSYREGMSIDATRGAPTER